MTSGDLAWLEVHIHLPPELVLVTATASAQEVYKFGPNAVHAWSGGDSTVKRGDMLAQVLCRGALLWFPFERLALIEDV
jgi:hypothetical protein